MNNIYLTEEIKKYKNDVINPENKKKKITKLSVIRTKNRFITSIEPFINKQTLKNGSKTSVQDVKMVNKTLENIKCINKKRTKNKNIYVLGLYSSINK